MAINPQLKEYIDQQIKVGVSNDVIKSALLEAGWQESDINQAIAFASSAGAAAVKSVEMTKPAEIKPIEIKPIEIKLSDTFPVLSKFSPSSGLQEKSAPVSFVTNDIFQPKNEPVFESKGTVAQTSFPGNKPQIASAVEGEKMKSGNNFFQKPIVPIALGAVSVLLLVGAGILYKLNSDLRTQLDLAKEESVSLQNQSSFLTSDKSGLTDQITSLNQTVSDLNNQLSIFAVYEGTSTAELPIGIKGKLGGGGKLLYSITTGKAIVVYVKNSKDVRVDGALKPLIGNQVEISGTHMAGSNVATVTSINGQSLKALVQPTTTSTPNAASTP